MAKHALIVDDSKTACKTLAQLLAKHDVQSTSVHSAEAALEELRHNKPDVIFLDHSMPGMDGLETVKVIKSDPATATIPVMMYTAKEGDVYLGQARALGALDVLPKGQLHERLEQALEKLRFTPRGERPPVPAEPPARTPSGGPAERALSVSERLDRLQQKLTRQMYMVLTEGQISQKDTARWLLATLEKRLERQTAAHEARLTAMQREREELTLRRTRRGRRWLIAVTALILAAFGLLLWQTLRLQATQARSEARLTHVEQQLAELDRSAPEASPQPTERTAAAGPANRLALVDARGRPAGHLLGLSRDGEFLQAVSPSGYLFQIDTRGAVGLPLQRRYFEAPDCNGQPLVSGQADVVYRADGRLWFTPQGGAPARVRPASALDTAGLCQPVNGPARLLRPLKRNDPQITGISARSAPLKLAATD